jgi:predicted esterase
VTTKQAYFALIVGATIACAIVVARRELHHTPTTAFTSASANASAPAAADATAPASASALASADVSAHAWVHPGVAIDLGDGLAMHEASPYLSPDDAPRPVTFILHAICADEIWMCDWLQWSGDLSPQWQLCPRAPSRCDAAGTQWKWTANGAETLALLQRALDSAKQRHGARIGDAIVLVGMSQGAYEVARVLHVLAQQPTPTLAVRGVVLHGAQVSLRPSDLKKLDVRVVLAAGDEDAAAPHMRALAAALKANGVDARWASFGADVGHFLPVDSAKPMAELIAWARGGD